MVIRHNPNFYKWILICSFLLLTSLIGLLVFNTYQYKDRDFQLIQKKKIESAYGKYVMNDKLFPGGNKLFQEYLEPQLPDLLEMILNDSENQSIKSQEVSSSFFKNLAKNHTMDSVFHEILAMNNLDTTLSYKMVFDRLDILLPNSKDWFTFFQYNGKNKDAQIAGNLKKWSENSKVLQLSVSDGGPVNYRFTYSFYVDYHDRWLWVFKDMLPVFTFSFLSVLLIIVINYLTYRNWINQRKDSQLKTDFLNHIRHEFNTPITTILVCAESLKEQQAHLATTDIESLGKVIERQASRLKIYFKQILGSVALTNQNPDWKTEDISLLTGELLKDISLRHAGKIKIEYKELTTPAMVPIDASYYFSILDNLVSNGLNFNQNEHPTMAFYWEYSAPNSLILNIKDNGIGITEQDLKNIFDKFYRSKTNGNRPGLGLGLYYVKTLIDLLGWDIKVESKVGEGSVFKVFISTTS